MSGALVLNKGDFKDSGTKSCAGDAKPCPPPNEPRRDPAVTGEKLTRHNEFFVGIRDNDHRVPPFGSAGNTPSNPSRAALRLWLVLPDEPRERVGAA